MMKKRTYWIKSELGGEIDGGVDYADGFSIGKIMNSLGLHVFYGQYGSQEMPWCSTK